MPDTLLTRRVIELTSFYICFRVRQSADHMLFRLQNGDFTCYELKKTEWHSVAVYSVYSTAQYR